MPNARLLAPTEVWSAKIYSNGWKKPGLGTADVTEKATGVRLGEIGIASAKDVSAAAAAAALSRQLSTSREGARENWGHAAATAFCHCVAASARKVRSVDRETRWRCRVNVLWTEAWILRKRCADRADLNRCILRSRRRTA
jgi:hypothetical protein